MRNPVMRWFISLPAGIFYALVALSVYPGLGTRTGALVFARTLARLLFPCVLGEWVLADARKRGRGFPYDFGNLLFFAWPFVIPWYLFSTRGWRGFGPIAWFALLWMAALAINEFMYGVRTVPH